LWIDYDAAISLHRATDVKPGLPAKDRLGRLASTSLVDKRISHGCVNVTTAFYDDFIRTTFDASAGIVYILPDTKPIGDVFDVPASNRHVQGQSRPAGLAG